MLGWKTAPAGTEPPGWEWLWELRAEGSDATTVTLTYDWTDVSDPELLKKCASRWSRRLSWRTPGNLASAATAT